jgi:asparagine synthase (glutamine-hydrolysing)
MTDTTDIIDDTTDTTITDTTDITMTDTTDTTKLNHYTLHNRGPDAKKIIETDEYIAAFYRLAIVGLDDGMQPFNSLVSISLCNGEIYNYKELARKYEFKTETSSDVECISKLYEHEELELESFVSELNGEFAFCIYDKVKKLIHFARDKFGRKPLYYGYDVDLNGKPTTFEVGSLYKSLSSTTRKEVIPGVIYTYDVSRQIISEQQYHRFIFTMDKNVTYDMLYESFVKAVQVRVTQTERALGFLLSGGFDSSLVLSTALKHKMLKTPPHVFTVGFSEDASDVIAATKLVEWFYEQYGRDSIIWHKVILPLEQGLNAIPDVISALETYDTTTIRASVPMYLISKFISTNTNVKVIISGEGSDELFGGYLYFKYAPNNQAMRGEIVKLLTNLYKYDVMRADRSTSEHGLEVRTPFLDDDFVKLVLSSKLYCSNETTKVLIRDIVKDKQLLPDYILHGRKEAFSDAVGFCWKDSIVSYCSNKLQEHMIIYTSPYITANSYETKYYQTIFYEKFGDWSLCTELWLPNQTWVKTGDEPSARALPVY